jgi:hypothetical protein
MAQRPLAEGGASDEAEILSGRSHSWKQFCPVILQAASKYPVYGVEQLPRNGNECLQTGFVFEPGGFRKRLLRRDHNGMRPAPNTNRSSQSGDFPHGSCETPSSLELPDMATSCK